MSLAELLDQSFETTVGPKTLREILDPVRPTVFISTPMDFTPVCTMQMCNYRDNWAEFSKLDCRWWGVNQASPELRAKFKEKKNLPMELITDPKGELLSELGLWGMLRTRRGFAIVSPDARVLATTHSFPFFYPGPQSVLEFVRPHLASA